MDQKLFAKWLSIILSSLLIFTSIPFPNGVEAEEKDKSGLKEVSPDTTVSEKEKILKTKDEAAPVPKRTPKEIPTLRTEKSKTIDNGDGTYTKQVYAEPIYKKQGENLSEISTKLTERPIKPDQKLAKTGEKNTISTLNTDLQSSFMPKMQKGKYAEIMQMGPIN